MRYIALPALFLVMFGVLASGAQAVNQRANRDEAFLVPNEDPVMAAAMRKARASLKDFLAQARAPGPKMQGFAVKVAVHEGTTQVGLARPGHSDAQVGTSRPAGEYFWITPFEQTGERFTGAINNTPRVVRSVSAGQKITFSESEISDWMYMDNGKMKGNFTACALLAREPKAQAEAFKRRFSLDCGA